MWAPLLILIMLGKRYELQLEPNLVCVNLNMKKYKIKYFTLFFPCSKCRYKFYSCSNRREFMDRRVMMELSFLWKNINLLNAELNPICHLLVLLGDLTFMGPCIVSIFQYISNKMQSYPLY
jgi:hypothetical protein